MRTLAIAKGSIRGRPRAVRRPLACALAVALGAAGCEPAPAPQSEPAAGAREAREERAERVVALSPLATRFIGALGAGDALVGADVRSVERLAPGVPVTDLAGASALAPDLVLRPPLPPGEDRAAAELALEVAGVRVVELDPHDLEDVFDLIRDVGGALVGAAEANRFETRLARPLAQIAGEAPALGRPRVVAVRSLVPLVIAGGHSFETDLIEIAGGRSVTHPGEASSLQIDPADWTRLAPDLVLLVEGARREAAEAGPEGLPAFALPAGVPVEPFAFERDFWLGEPTEPARRLRTRVAARAEELRAGR